MTRHQCRPDDLWWRDPDPNATHRIEQWLCRECDKVSRWLNHAEEGKTVFLQRVGDLAPFEHPSSQALADLPDWVAYFPSAPPTAQPAKKAVRSRPRLAPPPKPERAAARATRRGQASGASPAPRNAEKGR